MGKISEALKKAGKANPPASAVPKAKLKVQDTVLNVPQPGFRLERPIQAQLTEMGQSGSGKAAGRHERADSFDKPIQLTEPADKPSEPEVRRTDPEAPRETDDGLPINRSRPSQPTEQSHVAMVKAPVPLRAEPPVSPEGTPRSVAGVTEQQNLVQQPGRRPIQVSYTETQVQALDPEKLKDNRIFSFFDDVETTNQVKILRTKVLKKLEAIGGNSILVTSANPYEGKTFTSINLGVSIAKEFSLTVLIIDADLRKPTKRHTAFSSDFFSINVELGLTEYLKGEADIRDILINPGIDRLTLIPAGKPVDNAPELLNSTRMAEMMAEVKSRYGSQRLVIVDGPAMLPFPDALILSRHVDGVIAVVEMERTRTEDLKKMMEGLKETRVLGTVLNKNKDLS